MHAASWINEAALTALLALSTPPAALARVPHARMSDRVQAAGSPREQAVKRSDSRIKAQVEAALAADASLRGRSIFVSSVDDGLVVLAGTADTMSDHLRATGDAARVPGVHRVANQIKSQDLLADEESWGERGSPRADRSYRATDAMRDTETTSATKARLLADSPTPGLDLVKVDTRNGAVRVFGTVPPARVKAVVEEGARKLSGVEHVVNEAPDGRAVGAGSRERSRDRARHRATPRARSRHRRPETR